MGETIGEVETDGGVLVIRRIHVTYRLKAQAGHREEIRRAFDAHPSSCPVYRTLAGCIDITTELTIEQG